MKRKYLTLIGFILLATLLTACDNNDEPMEDDSISDESPSQALAFETISTQELEERLDDSDWVIVDTRGNDSFNGWQLYGEERGGQIAGAVDFSSNWLDEEVDGSEERLDNKLTDKGILSERNIVLYDANGMDALKVAEFLAERQFENIFIYDIMEWAADPFLPMEKYENYHLIVPAEIANQILNGEKPVTFENADTIKFVNAGWSDAPDDGVIPTAFHIDTDSVEPPPTWMLDSDENLAKWALDFGFHVDDTVILSGDDQLAAYRIAVILQYIGVSDVRVINGGNGAWLSMGFELEDPIEPIATTDFGAIIPVNSHLIITIPELKERLEQPDSYVLLDNRSWEEHIGETSGYSYHELAGRIPGSVFGHAGFPGAGSSAVDYFRNIDNTMRNASEFIALWTESGIDLGKHLMFMCGSGWRASEILFYAHVVGLENTSLYSDGWIGWSGWDSEPVNPVETGIPQ